MKTFIDSFFKGFLIATGIFAAAAVVFSIIVIYCILPFVS